jgi:hypothetical protein
MHVVGVSIALAAGNESPAPGHSSHSSAPTLQQLHETMTGIAHSQGLSCDPWHDKNCLDEFKAKMEMNKPAK